VLVVFNGSEIIIDSAPKKPAKMKQHYNNYTIGLKDQFDPLNYPLVNDEIRIINEKSEVVPLHFKAEIIISFVKNHSLQNNWIAANPGLTELVTSHTLLTGSIESLFDSSRNNPVFRQDLEVYLKEKFSE
jgi:hypothetical protein